VITPEQHEQIQVWLDAADSGGYGAVDGVHGAAHLIKALFGEVRGLEARLADRAASPATRSKQSEGGRELINISTRRRMQPYPPRC
jgi:hypothetical protein